MILCALKRFGNLPQHAPITLKPKNSTRESDSSAFHSLSPADPPGCLISSGPQMDTLNFLLSPKLLIVDPLRVSTSSLVYWEWPFLASKLGSAFTSSRKLQLGLWSDQDFSVLCPAMNCVYPSGQAFTLIMNLSCPRPLLSLYNVPSTYHMLNNTFACI